MNTFIRAEIMSEELVKIGKLRTCRRKEMGQLKEEPSLVMEPITAHSACPRIVDMQTWQFQKFS